MKIKIEGKPDLAISSEAKADHRVFWFIDGFTITKEFGSKKELLKCYPGTFIEQYGKTENKTTL